MFADVLVELARIATRHVSSDIALDGLPADHPNRVTGRWGHDDAGDPLPPLPGNGLPPAVWADTPPARQIPKLVIVPAQRH